MPRLLERLGELRCLILGMLVSAAGLTVSLVGFRSGLPMVLVVGMVIATSAFSLGQPALFGLVVRAGGQAVAGIRTGYAQFLFLYCGSVGAAIVGGLGPLVGTTVAVSLILAVLTTAVILAVVAGPAYGSRSQSQQS
jgi:hypothetical protein